MKFAQAMIGLETKDYVAVAVAAEKAGFDSVALTPPGTSPTRG
jgi:alkanesulfonate monooxygenase SsuD/methylene tetrahydromethanopterin reductase-like flavin-dependent oxidoreductase (luciferase family)